METPQEDKDYYAVLGVSPTADQGAIGKAYRRLIKAVHPDARGGKSGASVGRRVAELVEAWRVLGDVARRGEYDAVRRAGLSRPSNGHSKTQQVAPRLEINPSGLDLGKTVRGGLVEGCITLSDRVGIATAVEISGEIPSWISISRVQASGSSLPGPITMRVRVDTTSLRPRRRHRAEIAFRLVNRDTGMRSLPETVEVCVLVTPSSSPLLEVRPVGWQVAEDDGVAAPHSVLLHLMLANRGGGAISGGLLGEPWLRLNPERFGPLDRDTPALYASVEVDRERWAEAGKPNGSVWVTSTSGDLREVSLLSDRASDGMVSQAVRISAALRAAVGFAGWAGPAVALWMGFPWGALLLAVVATLFMPWVLQAGRRGEARVRPGKTEANGWNGGPASGSPRFWGAIAMWALLGALLGAGAMAPGLGAVAGGIVGLGVTSRDKLLLGGVGLVKRWCHAYWSLIVLILAAAWAILGAGTLAAIGGWGPRSTMGGIALGWLVGTLQGWTRIAAVSGTAGTVVIRSVRGAIPVLAAGMGFIAVLSLLVGVGVGRGVAARTGVGSAPLEGSMLLALPSASLSSALLSLGGSLGLLLGFVLALSSLLPAIEMPIAIALPRSGPRRLWDWIVWTIEEMLARQAEDGGSRGAELETVSRVRLLMVAHWSALLIGGTAALLLLYSFVHLFLALFALLGILVG